MPDRRTHVDHCRDLYDYGFEEIHKWIDGTVKSRGPEHRVDRHDISETPDKAYDIFKDKVPPEYRKYIKDAVKDHIELDKRGGNIPSKTIGVEMSNLQAAEFFAFMVLYSFVLAYTAVCISITAATFLLFAWPLSIAFIMKYFTEENKNGAESVELQNKPKEHKDKYFCDTCGKEISKGEFERNGGQCDNCVIEDGAIGGGLI